MNKKIKIIRRKRVKLSIFQRKDFVGYLILVLGVLDPVFSIVSSLLNLIL